MFYGEHLNAQEIPERGPKLRCRSCRWRRATVEVFASSGRSRGFYCEPCGQMKLDELRKKEKR